MLPYFVPALLAAHTAHRTIPRASLKTLLQRCPKNTTSLEPRVGTIVRCPMLDGLAYHTGIIVGEDSIVELLGSGQIALSSFKTFKDVPRPTGNTFEMLCEGQGRLLVFPDAAAYALASVGKRRNYHILFNNCHRFIVECLNRRASKADTIYLLSTVEAAAGWHDFFKWRPAMQLVPRLRVPSGGITTIPIPR